LICPLSVCTIKILPHFIPAIAGGLQGIQRENITWHCTRRQKPRDFCPWRANRYAQRIEEYKQHYGKQLSTKNNNSWQQNHQLLHGIKFI
jgi:hypothetical protein